MSGRIPVKEVVVCEGKYDKIKLDSVIDADVLTLDGFGIFNNMELRALIRRAAKTRGVIVLTDSDSAGMMLRGHIKNIAGEDGVTHLYVPRTEGRERRKKERSKEGVLGVEGIDAEVLRELFKSFKSDLVRGDRVGRADLYADGFIGVDGAQEKRMKLIKRLSLPEKMTTPALISALSIMVTREEYRKICEELK